MPEDDHPAVSSDAPAAKRTDLWAAIILTTAGLLSAWASFQGGLWGGQEAEHFHRANAEFTRSSELSVVAGQREMEHSALFVAWLGAMAEGQTARSAYLERQFLPPFDAEFRKWRADLPADLRAAAKKVGRPQFLGLLAQPANAARASAMLATEEANRTGAIADRYDRWTVMLAGALFLAGMAAVVQNSRAKQMMIWLAAGLTVIPMVALILLPVTFQG